MGKHSDFPFIYFQIVGKWLHYTVICQKCCKMFLRVYNNNNYYYGFGECSQKITISRDICMDFEKCLLKSPSLDLSST